MGPLSLGIEPGLGLRRAQRETNKIVKSLSKNLQRQHLTDLALSVLITRKTREDLFLVLYFHRISRF